MFHADWISHRQLIIEIASDSERHFAAPHRGTKEIDSIRRAYQLMTIAPKAITDCPPSPSFPVADQQDESLLVPFLPCLSPLAKSNLLHAADAFRGKLPGESPLKTPHFFRMNFGQSIIEATPMLRFLVWLSFFRFYSYTVWHYGESAGYEIYIFFVTSQKLNHWNMPGHASSCAFIFKVGVCKNISGLAAKQGAGKFLYFITMLRKFARFRTIQVNGFSFRFLRALI